MNPVVLAPQRVISVTLHPIILPDPSRADGSLQTAARTFELFYLRRIQPASPSHALIVANSGMRSDRRRRVTANRSVLSERVCNSHSPSRLTRISYYAQVPILIAPLVTRVTTAALTPVAS